MCSFVLAVALVLAGTMLVRVPAAVAWPVIEVTSTQPSGPPNFPLVQTNFTLNYVGPGPASDWVTVSSPEGFQFLGCEAPAGWDCFAFTKGPSFASFRRTSGPIPPPALSFAISTVAAGPCVRFDFKSPPYETSDYIVSGCLVVDGPLSARPSSWGAVKSFYR